MYEKIDGSNCQVRMDGHRVMPGTRTKQVTKYGRGALRWMNAFQGWAMRNGSLERLDPAHVVFMEYLSNHNSQYDPREFQSNCIFIDLYDTNEQRFIGYEDAEQMLLTKGVHGLHFLRREDEGSIHSLERVKAMTRQRFREDPAFEGYVFKDYARQAFSKIVIEQLDDIMTDFVTRDVIDKVWTRDRRKRSISGLTRLIAAEVHERHGRELHQDVLSEYLRRTL
jgi:hypothetical protein